MILQLVIFGLLLAAFYLKIRNMNIRIKKYKDMQKTDSDTIVKLNIDKAQLIRDCETLLAMNKTRQLQRQLARKQNKFEAKNVATKALRLQEN
jgi:hypothetical protein